MEIKEILDRLERIDHKEYSGGFEFADSSTFNEMARCFEERKKMADYITNLQQENERLKEKNKMLQEDAWRNNDNLMEMVKEELEKSNCEECEICEDYKSRIEKAVEYIEKNQYKAKTITSYAYGSMDIYEICCESNDLLDILNGRSDE